MNPKNIERLLRTKCEGCGGCCSKPVVPVTDADVKRLAKRTGKKARDIVRLYDSSDFDYDTDAPLWLKMNYGKRALGLKKKQEKCIFLDGNNRCSVYEDRPATCRTFPLQIDINECGDIGHISLNRIIKKKYPLGKKQPISKIKKHALMEENEDQNYYEKIENWNEKISREGKDHFLKFLGL